MAESFRFSVGLIGSSSGPKRITNGPREVSLKEALVAVRNLPVSEDQKQILSDLAKKIPHGSLGNFLSNYSAYLKKP